MWRRIRSKSMAPRRPAVFPEQWPLVAVVALAILGGVALAVYGVWN